MARGRCVHCKVEISVPDQLRPRRPHQVRLVRDEAQGRAGRGAAAGAGGRGPLRDALARTSSSRLGWRRSWRTPAAASASAPTASASRVIYALYQVSMRGEPERRPAHGAPSWSRSAERRHARARQLGLPGQAPRISRRGARDRDGPQAERHAPQAKIREAGRAEAARTRSRGAVGLLLDLARVERGARRSCRWRTSSAARRAAGR